MWTCPRCAQQFLHNNQQHSCNDKTLEDFLAGKSTHTLTLFDQFIEACRELGNISIHPTKSMIGIANDTRFCFVARLGKDFIDIVFPFTQAFPDTLLFHRVAQVPGSQQFNHHCRIQQKEDMNKEFMSFLRMAYEGGLREKK